jgi:hypothetical protein
MVYRIPQLSANLRQRSAAQLEPRAQPRAARPNSPRRQIDLSSRRGCRQHFLAATRKSTNRRPYGAFCARREGSLRTEQTTGSESWPIPKCRHYVIGPTGVGKTGLACGLLLKALQNGHRCQFVRAQDLFDELYAALADRSTRRLLNRLARLDVLLIDEFGYLNLKPEQSNTFFKLMEERYHRHSTIITTNLGYDEWHNFLGNKSMVDALLSRVRHYCHTVTIDGPSLRDPQG